MAQIMTAIAERTQKLTVVCNGWGIAHPEMVITPGDPGADKSHGMCERCALLMDASFDLTPIDLEAYRTYLESPFDPRD